MSEPLSLPTPFDEWAYAFGKPLASGRLRSVPEDFRVEEELGFVPDGEGQHRLLKLRKREANTEWVARELARFAGVAPLAVGYAGLKDRHAVTTQWFSVDLRGRPEPAWEQFARESGVEVLEVAAHRQKLRRGALWGNRFELVVRQLTGEGAGLKERLQTIAREGVPNYFGEQRFGRGGANLERAAALLGGRLKERDRHRRGLYLSAARSFLFNEVLAARVQRGDWNHLLPGEVVVLEGSGSHFLALAVDERLERRRSAGDCHPSGPLWGTGALPSRQAAREVEMAALEPYPQWRSGLEAAGLRQERRPLRLLPGGLQWRFLPAGLHLQFELPAGCYATAVLRELIAAA